MEMTDLPSPDLPHIKAFALEMLEVSFKDLQPVLSSVEKIGFRMLVDRIRKNINSSPVHETALLKLTDDFINIIKKNPHIKKRLLEELKE
jgi:hypothetical protein